MSRFKMSTLAGHLLRMLDDQERMRDMHIFAEWQAHYADRDYCVLMQVWGERTDRPLPIYHLRTGAI